MNDYRYRLYRDFPLMAEGPRYMFIGVNPSTADDHTDDATIRKMTGFVSRWNGSGFCVGNLFAARATDVRELSLMEDPIGQLNDGWLTTLMLNSDIVVPCWGSRNKIPDRLHHRIDDVVSMIKEHHCVTKCFGVTNSGDPKHPLMLGYNSTLENWK